MKIVYAKKKKTKIYVHSYLTKISEIYKFEKSSFHVQHSANLTMTDALICIIMKWKSQILTS